jgi:hypothetical protein
MNQRKQVVLGFSKPLFVGCDTIEDGCQGHRLIGNRKIKLEAQKPIPLFLFFCQCVSPN